jgi:ABC-2 type transport system ATP-binding protein
VLSDAEALCSRVAILAGGRLVASGPLTDMTAFETHGWELVAGNVSDAAARNLAGRVRRMVTLGPGRYTFELPLEPPPECLIAELTAGGARIVSLNPIRDTLEDFFVRQVARGSQKQEVRA